MTTLDEDSFLHSTGEINTSHVANLVQEYCVAGDWAALRDLRKTTAAHLPKSFRGAFRIFSEIIGLLDEYKDIAVQSGIDAGAVVGDWAACLGLTKREHLDAMLEMTQDQVRVDWLMSAGADPNGVIDASADENLTILGRAARIRQDDNVLKSMVRTVLQRGEMPYSVKPRYEGDPEGCDLIRAVMTGVAQAGWSSPILIGEIGEASRQGYLPMSAQHAIGQIFLSQDDLVRFESINMSRAVNYVLLSFARFQDPLQWETAFGNVAAGTGMASLFPESREATLKRVVDNIALDGMPIDDLPVYITNDDIQCTLLQAAAYVGAEHAVTLLLNAGADPLKKLVVETGARNLDGLDAIGLWHSDPSRQPSEAFSAWKARHAVDTILRQGKANAPASVSL